MAIELQGSLQNMKDQDINAVLGLVRGIHSQLVRDPDEFLTSKR